MVCNKFCRWLDLNRGPLVLFGSDCSLTQLSHNLCPLSNIIVNVISGWGRLNSWVVSHSALIIGTLRHALGREFRPCRWQTLFGTQAQHMLYSWFYLVWYYYLSVKFVMWIVKQKIENKRNLFLKKWANPGLFFCLFSVFSNKENIFYNKSMWKMSCPSSVRCQDSRKLKWRILINEE